MAYASVAVEGGLFPSDLLDRIATGDAEGQRPADFGLDGARRLVDEIQSAFSDARSFWDAFQRRLERSRESKTTITREDWVVPFLELLGFYQIQVQRASAEAGGEKYPISHRTGEDPTAPPVHIVALEQELDRREGARRSPHALVQDYLNRSDALWGIVTNGSRLRLLRDSARLAKPTYLEFDLEGMITGNLYSEFVLLYRLTHSSRFPRDAAAAHECLLERYYQQGIDEGGRVREKLRDGVEEALKVLGTAFLAHQDSRALRDRFAGGQLDAPRFYRQLLRLVYRLLFLMVAEERRLIFPPGADMTRQAVYTKYYGVTRLRDRAERYFAADTNGDLWLGLRETFRLFRDNDAAQKLGLAALDGELFSRQACEDLEGAGCTNWALLTAIRRLSIFVDEGPGRGRRRSGGIRRRVNYSGLDVEEFGSVYESLLDFHSQVTLVPPTFDLVAGSERRQTGSYYTPPELVRELVDHALVPVMEEALAKAKTPQEKEETLLELLVCDPAAGSGHFLLAAARRIARELARVRTGEDEPAPEEYRQALRDVIRQCVYAVDKNPLAVDLCKVALWIEGHNAGLPLSFLDHHVKCGDSLVGVFDLKVLEEGIPDAAFERTDAGQKDIARALRDRNRRERQGQLPLAPRKVEDRLSGLADGFDELVEIPDDTPERVAEKTRRYDELRSTKDALDAAMACHLWTAPFFMTLRARDSYTPTTATLHQFLRQPAAVHGQLAAEAQSLALDHRFFHWPLEFPDVFAAGGFDVVLSNPPFMGGQKISGNFGDCYRRYLSLVYVPAGATCDLCGYVYRRAYSVLGPGGRMGMVAVNTISEGDTRRGSLAVLLQDGAEITFVRQFVKWQGAANVEVSLVGIHKGALSSRVSPMLDGREVPFISSRFDTEPEQEPAALEQNKRKCFQGSILQGMGFVLEPEDAARLTARDRANSQCLFPYMNGEDLNSRPDHSPSRWVINFFDWPLPRAQRYADLMKIVEERVKPEREKINRKRNKERWWIYAENRPGLYGAIRGLQRVLVRAATSELHMPVFVPNGIVYAHALYVFAFDDDYHFALLQSNAHEAWLRRNASTMRTDIRYTPTDCFETFPFPQDPSPEDRERANRLGAEYHEHRRQAMLARNLGLTKTYNLFHNPVCKDEDIVRLRELHAEMDRAVLACYGWQDLDPGHGFYQNERGQTRYTVSPEARREILRRLLELNLEIAESQRTGPPLRAKAQEIAS